MRSPYALHRVVGIMTCMLNDTVESLMGPLNDVESKYVPKHLYYAGRKELLRHSPRVAIVGSREASEKGRERAATIARQLTEQSAVIVSGLARGIDTAAHTAAIESGGATIAVLGNPLDVFQPRPNKALQELIMRDHLAVSQFAPGSPVRPGNFPIRNRTMALICQASIIVEAGDGSGTLSQGWEALRLGRPLFIVDNVVANPDLEWPNEMISYGARTLGDDLDELFAILPPPGKLSPFEHAF
jgi:DNA processing protein